MTLVKCDNCGKVVDKIPANVRRAKNHFCSKKCHNEWRSENVRGKNHPLFNRKKIKCDFCGKEFFKKPSHIGERNYCSRECKDKDRSERGRTKVVCATCGKEFERYKSHAEKVDKHFCSRECYNEKMGEGEDNPNWKGGSVTKECQYCGEKFEVKPARKDDAKFCSRECHHRWMSEYQRGENHPLYGEINEKMQGEKNPAWKGGYEPYYGKNWQSQRRKVLERDNHICQICGVEENGREHSVHHIKPLREFDVLEKANALDNLVTLCKSCHGMAEAGKIPKEKLRGEISPSLEEVIKLWLKKRE